jgi:hypothetical protein
MSAFQYAAEAYRLLLTLVDLIVRSLFEPLRYAGLSVLLLCVGGGLWLFIFSLRRRSRAGMTR